MQPEKDNNNKKAPESVREQLLRDIMKLPEDVRRKLLAPYINKRGGIKDV